VRSRREVELAFKSRPSFYTLPGKKIQQDYDTRPYKG
jgi:hypothetical protein